MAAQLADDLVASAGAGAVSTSKVDYTEYHRMRTLSADILETSFGGRFMDAFPDRWVNATLRSAQRCKSSLAAARDAVDMGLMTTITTVAAAEVFVDFLDAAGHLLEQGYKDPSAALVGAVLEDGLRRIAREKSIGFNDAGDASSVNQALAQGRVFSSVTRKQVEVWIGIRNNAVHGRFSEYSSAQAAEMIDGVRRLLSDYLGR